MRSALYAVKQRLTSIPYRLTHQKDASWACPICGYSGPFRSRKALTGVRLHAQCPGCGSLERHRIQYLAMGELFASQDMRRARMLHFAPEHFLATWFKHRVGTYETADISMPGVDHHVDLRKLPFRNGSYDFVFASHVLEHVDEDDLALGEIRRVLSPRGIAVLPVPVVSPRTVEYPAPNPHEEMHVRAPGEDYFERYRAHFPRIEFHRSSDFPADYQCFIHEDRSQWPTAEIPLRPAMPGARHEDVVPVCHVNPVKYAAKA